MNGRVWCLEANSDCFLEANAHFAETKSQLGDLRAKMLIQLSTLDTSQTKTGWMVGCCQTHPFQTENHTNVSLASHEAQTWTDTDGWFRDR